MQMKRNILYEFYIKKSPTVCGVFSSPLLSLLPPSPPLPSPPSPKGWNHWNLEDSGLAGTRSVSAGPSLDCSRAGSRRPRFIFTPRRSRTASCWEVCTHTGDPQVSYPARLTGRQGSSHRAAAPPGLLLSKCGGYRLPVLGSWLPPPSVLLASLVWHPLLGSLLASFLGPSAGFCELDISVGAGLHGPSRPIAPAGSI